MNRTKTGLTRLFVLTVLAASMGMANAQTITPRVGLTLSKTEHDVSKQAKRLEQENRQKIEEALVLAEQKITELNTQTTDASKIVEIEKQLKTAKEANSKSVLAASAKQGSFFRKCRKCNSRLIGSGVTAKTVSGRLLRVIKCPKCGTDNYAIVRGSNFP